MNAKEIKITLKKLKNEIFTRKNEIYAALEIDLNKSVNETEITEILPVINEINSYLKHIKKWSKPKRRRTPWSLRPGKSYIYHKPYGTVFILSTWNYPFNLSLIPLIDAFAAGNNVILKLSDRAQASRDVIEKIIKNVFTKQQVLLMKGDIEETNRIIQQEADFVFFTGSNKVGNEIYKKAAEKMIPCVLELGGKNPAIITKSANIKLAVWDNIFVKIMNMGQTCLATDHIYIDASVKGQFELEFNKALNQIHHMLTNNDLQLAKMIDKYAEQRIINFQELEELETSYLDKILLLEPSRDSKIMQEEIFGPLLPIIPYDNLETLAEKLSQNNAPLAIYLFSNNKADFNLLQEKLDAGTIVYNSTSKFIYNNQLPFGGVKHSGIGRYHGKAGFKTFTYQQAVYKASKVQLISPKAMTKIMLSKNQHWIVKLLNWVKK
ncbi:aldehyde dehydrogenase family protein [Mycoplasma seminis]|uniref:Aldehyde dehydrogenase n=1 Tax=Mycoplasma seminis TaxID=512749 RepID=A0ABY9H9Z4_9MOLU|nr:aldehyde dehydrogenase family protein [Mycoplasma seminis]WLP85418.1 aldehyde dehydrogenase family protein [Mycoplasma seminis]